MIKANMYVKSILDIDVEKLKENNIQAIILDIDDTLMTYGGKILEGASDWIKEIKLNNIDICLLSNNFSQKRMEKVKQTLDIEKGIRFACKPLNIGLSKAKYLLEDKKIAIIGDSTYTDILCAKLNKIFCIKTESIEGKMKY